MKDKPELTEEEQRQQLEAEMEKHKQRFLSASRRGLDAVRADASLANWVGTYPVQSALIAFAGGFFLGVSKSLDRKKLTSVR